jgi:hypothetical protein
MLQIEGDCRRDCFLGTLYDSQLCKGGNGCASTKNVLFIGSLNVCVNPETRLNRRSPFIQNGEVRTQIREKHTNKSFYCNVVGRPEGPDVFRRTVPS